MRNRSQVVLPLNLEICIPKDDPVFKMVEICEQLDYTELYRAYLRSWRKINPETLFELLVFGYMNRKYSARQIEEACRTDIRFMWILQGEPVPDHSTIARFQNEKLTGVIEDLFYQLVEKLHEAGEVGFRNIFVDGTKIEANAGRYTFVWKKAVEKHNAGLDAKVEKVMPVLRERYGFSNEASVSAVYESLLRQAQWNQMSFAKGAGHRKTQLQKDIETLEEYFSKKEEYENHLQICGNRSSYSKTDTDATFMRMKEDHMKNGQLKAGYNIQIGVESEYIVGVGAFSNRTDVQTLIPFLNRIKMHTQRKVEQVIADAGYESKENYLYLKENGQKSFIKPQNYEISKTRKYKSNPYRVENMTYDKENDSYICPNGDVLHFAYSRTERTSSGYEAESRYYRNESCEGCPHYGKCHNSERGFREIRITPQFVENRKESLANILTDEGVLLRKNRSIQVEGVFGILKQDYNFRRFLVRGKRRIETQFFLLAFAFNVEKLKNRQKSGRCGQDLFPLKAV